MFAILLFLFSLIVYVCYFLGLNFFLFILFGPAFNIQLAGPANAQSVRRHVLGNGAAGADISIRAHFHRRHQVGVATYKSMVADLGAVFLFAVIVDGDAAAAHIDPAADIAVADIS